MIGAVLGGLIYVLFIQMHHSNPDPEVKAEPAENNLEKHELSVIM
jgi:aquaporin-9